MKKCLIIRWGALGDCLIITPVLKRLKELGYYNIVNTSQRGMKIFKHNPNVDEFIEGKDNEKTPDELLLYWKKLKDEIKPDKFINFSESIECNVALHPVGPAYIYPKYERFERCDRNYYDVTEEWAKLEGCQKTPEMYFTEEEEKEAKKHIRRDRFNILWCLSGSGRQKVYPWTDYVIGEVLKTHKDVHFITTGDKRCQLLETLSDEDITNLSGEIDIRVAMLLTKYVDLVISPDTGILHASGMFDTPKIGLLGHTTKNNITKYFKNDYSIEAECACAPCFHLIYDHVLQCPLEPVTGASWCMAEGIKPERVYERIEEVYQKNRNT